MFASWSSRSRLLFQDLRELLHLGGDGLLALGDAALQVVQIFLLHDSVSSLRFERVLAAWTSDSRVPQLRRATSFSRSKCPLAFRLLLLGGQLDFLRLVLGLAGGVVADLLALGAGPGKHVLGRGCTKGEDRPRADHQPDQAADHQVGRHGCFPWLWERHCDGAEWGRP
jgi:hypothetical protein